MRAIAYAVIGILTLTAARAASADDMSNMKGMSAAPAAKHGKGTGVIKVAAANIRRSA